LISRLKSFQLTPLAAEDQAKLCSIKDDAKRIGEVGEISVWVFRKSESIMSKTIANYSLKSSPVGAVHEKDLKGQSKSHGTSLVQTSQC